MTDKDRILLQAQIERSTYDILTRIANREERSLAAQIRFILAAYVMDEYNHLQQKGYINE